MWDTLIDYFRRYPAQEKIARKLIALGLCIRDDTVFCGDIKIADSALARAAGTDRRIVAATIQTIQDHPELRQAFSRFQPTLHLKEVAPALGWGVLIIVPENASTPGILAGVSSIIAREGISVRQAVVDDPDFIDEPKLYIVTEEPLPPRIIPDIQGSPGVKSVTMY